MAYKDLTLPTEQIKYYQGVAKNEFAPRYDLRRKKIGRLTVLDFDHKGGKNGRTYYYKCICECGNEVIKSSQYLMGKRNPHKSCGCWHREINIAASTTHKHGSKSNKTYKTWVEMKLRCTNPNNTAYMNYGGRGIKVCDRWINSFENFLTDMGERPSTNYSLDRIDHNGDYCPENCRWATRKEQCNNRRSNIMITYKGRTQSLKLWCDEFGLNFQSARHMLRKTGRSFEYIVKYQLNKKQIL